MLMRINYHCAMQEIEINALQQMCDITQLRKRTTTQSFTQQTK